MEGNNRETPTRIQDIVQLRQSAFQLPQLVVNGDTKRLKDLCRWMDMVVFAMIQASDFNPHHFGQILRRVEALPLALIADLTRQLFALVSPNFAVFAEYSC